MRPDTARSLPGMARALRTTRSPGPRRRGPSPAASCERPARGSAWEPVASTSRRSGGRLAALSRGTKSPSVTEGRKPSSRAISMLRTRLRPIVTTLRSSFRARSSTWWMRCRWEANMLTTMRPRDVVEEPLEGLLHQALAARLVGALGVGGVGQEAEHALLAELAPALQVGAQAVDGVRVQLEVPGVDDGALGGVDDVAHGVGHGVGDAGGLDLEVGAHGEGVAGLYLPQVRLHPQLPEPVAHHPQREAGAIDGDGHLVEQEGQGAHVVLVAVGQEDALEQGGVAPEVGEVRDDDVHAQGADGGEHQPAVDEEHLPTAGDDHGVEADLAESSQGNHMEHALHIWAWRGRRPQESPARSLSPGGDY